MINYPESGERFNRVGGFEMLSDEAYLLHGFGVVDSVRSGKPGFVDDEYLNSMETDTTTSAFELVVAGLWERREAGYLVTEASTVNLLLRYNEDAERSAAQCRVRGRHLPDDAEGGWVWCRHCDIAMYPDTARQATSSQPPGFDSL